MNSRVCIISHLRSANVPKMHAITGENVHWYVGPGEADAYRAAGAKDVKEADGLCACRNAALRDSFAEGRICIQLSDDLSKIEWTTDGKTKQALSFDGVKDKLCGQLTEQVYLVGVSPTPNAFYFHKPISVNAFIIGDLFAVRPCGVFFDETFKLKEDYDYTAQHIKQYGYAIRVNGILATFGHYTNKGGAVSVRTPELEQEMILRLMRKHPQFIRPNKRRENEVLFRAPRS